MCLYTADFSLDVRFCRNASRERYRLSANLIAVMGDGSTAVEQVVGFSNGMRARMAAVLIRRIGSDCARLQRMRVPLCAQLADAKYTDDKCRHIICREWIRGVLLNS